MDLFVYSDESGVFDVSHNRYYVFGGLILVGKDEKDICSRKYMTAEKVIAKNYKSGYEIKASLITGTEKGKLFRSLNQYSKFGVVIEQQRVHPTIFQNKKSKQRYLDYTYKIAFKKR